MPTFTTVIKIVTAFTIAHSLALVLATLNIVTLPSRLVESVIAISVFLAAINNIFCIVRERRVWIVAFVFGLIHGFGFAGVMSEFVLDEKLLLITVLTFNLGVEAGQLVIVCLFLPIAFKLRKSRLYRQLILNCGSIIIALLALSWVYERVLSS